MDTANFTDEQRKRYEVFDASVSATHQSVRFKLSKLVSHQSATSRFSVSIKKYVKDDAEAQFSN